tara:strand:- start:1964 stop:2464 length:501 start_codon:yes stop_codon:yes gene_type:complete
VKKIILSEQDLYCGYVSMPKGFEINPLNFTQSIIKSLYTDKFTLCKDWDKTHTYIKDFFYLKHKKSLVYKDTWGNVFSPNENTKPLLNIDPVDLRNSPDYTLLYGVNTVDCNITIYFDDNRRKGRSYTIELKNNMFVMFPSTNTYYIKNKQKESLNFVQTILYEYI